MLIDTLLFEDGPGEMRSAALADGRVVEVGHHRHRRPSQVGAIYRGRVRRIMPSLNVAFIDLGTGVDGFLRANGMRWPSGQPKRLNRLLHEGAALTVQVVRDAVADKGPVVTSLIELPGRFVDYTPGVPGVRNASTEVADELQALLDADEGVSVHRPWPDAAAIEEDLQALRTRWRAINAGGAAPAPVESSPGPVVAVLAAHRGHPMRHVLADSRTAARAATAWSQRYAPELSAGVELAAMGLFDTHGVEAAIDTALSPYVPLPGGGNLIFEEGEVLTAVDVNSGADEALPGRAAFETNLAAVPEIARQLRLRRIGGAVVIDFLKMRERAAQQDLVAAFRVAVADDPAGCHVLGLSGLGLLELTRRRTGPSLADELLLAPAGRLVRPETVAYRALRRLRREGRANPGQALAVTAAPAVAGLLQGELQAELAGVSAGAVTIRADDAMQIDRFTVGSTL